MNDALPLDVLRGSIIAEVERRMDLDALARVRSRKRNERQLLTNSPGDARMRTAPPCAPWWATTASKFGLPYSEAGAFARVGLDPVRATGLARKLIDAALRRPKNG